MTRILLLAKMFWMTLAASALDYEKVVVRGETDRDAIGYRPNEKMVFTFTAEGPGGLLNGHKLRYRRTGDDGQEMHGEAPSDQPLVLSTSLDRPGFVRFQVTLIDAAGNVMTNHIGWKNQKAPIMFDGGAGVEVENIRQAVPEPADFDAFWQRQKARLAAVPLKYQLQKIPSADPKYLTYTVKIDCAGPRPVTGYLLMPVDAKKKSLKALVGYCGYGVQKQERPTETHDGFFSFGINAHGYELEREPAYYKEFAQSISIDGKGYLQHPEHVSDPENSYLNGMALRVLRSLDFVKSLPEWNGLDIVASGSSQAGLQSAWAAGLDPQVVRWYTGVTFGCDLGGPTIGRIPHDWGIYYCPAVNYYDPVNFAKRMRCQVWISRAGLGDYTCPPSGLAALYNNIPNAKEITFVQGSTHGYVPKPAQEFTLRGNGKKKQETSAAAAVKTFHYHDWRLVMDAGGGVWRQLFWKEEELLVKNASQSSFDLETGDKARLVFQRAELDPNTGELTVVWGAPQWEVLEKIVFDAHGVPGLLARSASITFKPSQGGNEPEKFSLVGFNYELPKSGRYYLPASFLGDPRGISPIAGDPQGDRFRLEGSFWGRCAGMKDSQTVTASEYVMPMAVEQTPKRTLLFLIDDRRDNSSQKFTAGTDHLMVRQFLHAAGWALPGVTQQVGTAYLQVEPQNVDEALAAGTIWRWYRAIGFHAPAGRPDWVYDAALFEFDPGRNSLVSDQKYLLPYLERLGFGALWVMPLANGYMPRDFFSIQGQTGTVADYMAMVREAQRRGMKVWQDIVPHGGKTEQAQARGNSALALCYDVNGNARSAYGVMDFKSPEWQRYLESVAEEFMRRGVDGFRLDQCGGSPPNWRREGFPARDKTPANVDRDWWLESLDAVGGKAPALTYDRASLPGREGGMEVIRRIRKTVKAARPDGAVLAETCPAVYAQEGDLLYDFMGRLAIFKLHDMSPEDFAVALALRLDEQRLTDPQEIFRLRYVEQHDSIPVKAFVGNSAARALTAMIFLIRGMPLTGFWGFEIGNGVFLAQLNGIRRALPEFRRGEAFYRAVKIQPKSVFSVLRTLPGQAGIGLVNFSPDAVEADLTVPVTELGLEPERVYKLWNAVDGALLGEGKPASFARVKLHLNGWGMAVLAWRPAAEACPLSVPVVRSSSGEDRLAAETVLRCDEKTRVIEISGCAYRLAIDRNSGLPGVFQDHAGKTLLNEVRLLLGKTPDQLEKPVISWRKTDYGIELDVTRRLDRDGSRVVMRFQCRPDRVDFDCRLEGSAGGDTAALVFPVPAVERYQIDTAEGRLEDWFVDLTPGRGSAFYPSSCYWQHDRYYPQHWSNPILWQSNRNMLNPAQPAVRAFSAAGTGIEFTVNELLRQPPAETAVYSRLVQEKGWHLAVYLRQPGPLAAGLPGHVSLTFSPCRPGQEPAARPCVFEAAGLKVSNRSLGWRLDHAAYRLELQRLGGGIRSFRNRRDVEIFRGQDIALEKGFGLVAAPRFDYKASSLLWLDGTTLRFRFFAIPKYGNRGGSLNTTVWTLVEYALDSSAAFRVGSDILFHSGRPEPDALLAWKTSAPGAAQVELFRDGTPCGDGSLRQSEIVALGTGELPDRMLMRDAAGKEMAVISELKSSVPPAGAAVLAGDGKLLIADLYQSNKLKHYCWYRTGCVVSAEQTSAVPAQLSPSYRALRTESASRESFEDWLAPAVLLGAAEKPAAAPMLTIFPERTITTYGARFSSEVVHAGQGALSMADSDASRILFGAFFADGGTFKLSMFLHGRGNVPGTKLYYQLFYSAVGGKSGSLPVGAIDIPVGDFDWRQFTCEFKAAEPVRSPNLRLWLVDARGVIHIDDVELTAP